jgi:type II secretory pathway component PulC
VVARKTTISDQALPKNTKKAEKIHNYEIITDRNLFGTSSNTGAAQEKKDPLEGLAPTSLDVVLMGTVFGDSDEKRAIIVEKGQSNQEMFHVGDSVKGAIIKDILRGKVVLGYNDKDEVLSMNEVTSQTPEPAAVPPSRRQQKILRALEEEQPANPNPEPGISRTRIIPSKRKAPPQERQ